MYIYKYTYICIYIHMHTHIYICVYKPGGSTAHTALIDGVCVNVCVCVFVCASTHGWVYSCVYVRVCVRQMLWGSAAYPVLVDGAHALGQIHIDLQVLCLQIYAYITHFLSIRVCWSFTLICRCSVHKFAHM